MEELERTFLAKRLPEGLTRSVSKEMLDIYLPREGRHPVLRIRKRGDSYEMTKKQPIEEGDSSRQLETTIPLSQEEFEELAMLEGKRVHKIRYYYPYEGKELEVDVFGDALEGLVLIDAEFTSLKEKESFVRPEFCLAEVTQEEFIAGGMLCGKGYEDIEKYLAPFGYTRIAI